MTLRGLREPLPVGAPAYRLQKAVSDVARQLQGVEILQGVAVRDIELAGATETEIVHGLGRQPIGWFLIDLDADEAVYRTDWDSTSITLRTGTNAANIAIWIF